MGKLNGRKIEAMHSMYGTAHGTCGDCDHLSLCGWRSRSYYKCEAYSESRSEASDWRIHYAACGLFNQPLPDGFVRVLERLKRMPRPTESEPELPGQMDIFGEVQG